MKILVVDDEPDVVESVRLGLTLQWREVDVLEASTGERALDLVEMEHPDLVLLDVGLPDIDGYEVLRRTRAFSDVPVIILTARNSTMDKVKGLEIGADDYVTKPFNHMELLARIRAVLRRRGMPAPTSRAPSFRSGDLEVDFEANEARLRGERIQLTPTGTELLLHLGAEKRRPRTTPRHSPGQGLGPGIRGRSRLPAGIRAAAPRQALR